MQLPPFFFVGIEFVLTCTLFNKFAKYFYAHPNFNDINKEPFDRLSNVLPCIVFLAFLSNLAGLVLFV